MDQKKPIFGFFTLLLKTHPEKRKLLDFGKNRAKKKNPITVSFPFICVGCFKRGCGRIADGREEGDRPSLGMNQNPPFFGSKKPTLLSEVEFQAPKPHIQDLGFEAKTLV